METSQQQSDAIHRGSPHRMVGGVCAALAAHFGLEPLLVRIAFMVLTVVSFGIACWGYLLIWVATPAVPGGRAPLTRAVDQITRLFGPSTPGSQQV